MMSKIVLVVALLALMLPAFAAAQSSEPVNLALVTPVQIFPENTSITGVRLNLIYGKNVSMTGLDVGIVNAVGTGGFEGLQYGFVNMSDGDVTGWQDGALNLCNKKFEGWQDGWLNVTQGDVTGFQSGLFNRGEYVNGFQLGFVNYAASMKGLQVGIVNIIKSGGEFPVFPIVNWSF